MDLWVSKLISLFLLFFLTIFFGLLPLKFVAFLRKRDEQQDIHQPNDSAVARSRTQTILSYLNCFAGGVFFGTCLLHLFPEVGEGYSEIEDKLKLKYEYPLPYLTIAAGFFLIMIIEHAAVTLHNYHQQKAAEAANEHTPFLHHRKQDGVAGGYDTASQAGNAVEVANRVAEGPNHDFINSFSNSYECYNEEPHHHHPGQTHEETEQIHAIRSLLLLLAISLHTVFEGLALGLETTINRVWTLLAALAVHKCVISFTLGLQFADTFKHSTGRMVLYMFIYSLVCPVGVAIGIGISVLDTTSVAYAVTSMCLQGLATGTFLYVTFFEVLQRELGVEEHSISKVFAIIFGFAIIAATCFLEEL